MRFVALVSGGKDSVFSIGKALVHGHELVCLANLYPPDTGPEELDSFMFQSAGASAIGALAECLGVPVLRAPLRGGSGHQGLHYAVTAGDEVEDLYDLLRHVKVRRGVLFLGLGERALLQAAHTNPYMHGWMDGPPPHRRRIPTWRPWRAAPSSPHTSARASRASVAAWGCSPSPSCGRSVNERVV